jgi:uncharacterized protein (TIGR02301 family)
MTQRARLPLTAAFMALAIGAVAPALAQTRPPLLTETAQSRREQYSAELRQLAHTLGGAHYLRVLCVGKSDQSWRQFMVAMLDREGGPRRTDLVAAFNEGYRDIELRFPACSPAAQSFETDLKNQGLRLADTLSARHSD